MNLFVTDKNPYKSALFLLQDRRRFNKQILECCQILATNIYVCIEKENIRESKKKLIIKNCLPLTKQNTFYKRTHANHTVVKWARKNMATMSWIMVFFVELCFLFESVNGKQHFCSSNIRRLIKFYPDTCKFFAKELSSQSDFCNCTPYKKMGVFNAYRRHLREKWRREKISEALKKHWKKEKRKRGSNEIVFQDYSTPEG